MKEVLEVVRQVAPTRATVLLIVGLLVFAACCAVVILAR